MIIPSKRTITSKWHLISNWLIFIFLIYVSIGNTILFVQEVSKSQTETQGYHFYYTRLNIFSSYGWSHYLSVFLPVYFMPFVSEKENQSNSFMEFSSNNFFQLRIYSNIHNRIIQRLSSFFVECVL